MEIDVRGTERGGAGTPADGIEPVPADRSRAMHPTALRRRPAEPPRERRSDGLDGGSVGARPRIRVSVAVRELSLHQEVLDFLGRDPAIEMVAALTTGPNEGSPAPDADVVVACPTLAGEAAPPAGHGEILVVAQEMTVPVLRTAIEVGAAGVFAWPGERDDLVAAVRGIGGEAAAAGAPRGRVIAVAAVRGGTGATFVATHLAAALADGGTSAVVVDLEAPFCGLTAALGVRPDDGLRTVADLVPVAHELSPELVDRALHRHSRGFAALLGPIDERAPVPPARVYAGVIALLACEFAAVVLHLPRAVDDVVRVGLEMADETLLVAGLDAFSLYGARRSLGAFEALAGPGARRVVVNGAGRGELRSSDVRRVLGTSPAATIRFDAAVARAQARGALLGSRHGRAFADVRRLASRLVADGRASGSTAAHARGEGGER